MKTEKVYICQVNLGSISIFRFPYYRNLSLFLYILSTIATPSKWVSTIVAGRKIWYYVQIWRGKILCLPAHLIIEIRQSEKYRQCYKTYLFESEYEGMSMFNNKKNNSQAEELLFHFHFIILWDHITTIWDVEWIGSHNKTELSLGTHFQHSQGMEEIKKFHVGLRSTDW